MKFGKWLFGITCISCVGMGFSQNLDFLDSAKVAESKGEYLQALQIYENALKSHPDLELEIRNILQSYYEEFEFNDEAKSNQLRISKLDSMAQVQNVELVDTAIVSPMKEDESIGLYGQVKLGYQNWQKKELYQNLKNVQSYLYANVGYNWMWGSWSHDFSMGYMATLEDDGTLSKKDLGILGQSPDFNYTIQKSNWSSYLALQKGYSLGVLSSSKKSMSSSTSDTSTTMSMGISYDQELTSGSVLSYAFDLYSVKDETREWSLSLRTRPKWDAWSLGLEASLGQTKDLYGNFIQDIYVIPRMGLAVQKGIGVDTVNLNAVVRNLGLNSITSLESQYGQHFITMAASPRYKTQMGFQFDLNLRASYYREIQKENYYALDGNLYTGSIYKMQDTLYALTNFEGTVKPPSPSIMMLKRITESSQTPAWLNLSLRPGVKYFMGDSWVAGLWYNYVFDLYRKDYKHFPVGTGAKYYSSSWGGSVSYNF